MRGHTRPHAWSRLPTFCFFFLNNAPPTEIYSLSLPDALPISAGHSRRGGIRAGLRGLCLGRARRAREHARSEEHTSELQSQSNLVCRLLLEKKNDRVLTR